MFIESHSSGVFRSTAPLKHAILSIDCISICPIPPRRDAISMASLYRYEVERLVYAERIINGETAKPVYMLSDADFIEEFDVGALEALTFLGYQNAEFADKMNSFFSDATMETLRSTYPPRALQASGLKFEKVLAVLAEIIERSTRREMSDWFERLQRGSNRDRIQKFTGVLEIADKRTLDVLVAIKAADIVH